MPKPTPPPLLELAPPHMASQSGGITSVSRIPNSMEIFWIGGDGSIWDAHWYEGMTQWNRFLLADPHMASQNGGITSVSRRPDHMEIFWIGGDGSVWGASFYESLGWNRYQLAPLDMASKNGGITALSRREDHMEVFWIGGDGSIWAASLYESLGPTWNRYQLAPPHMASQSGGITAVSRREDHMEVFWIGGDGSIWGASLYESLGPTWNRYELAPAHMASQNGGIASLSRRQDHMETYWIGGDGSVWAASLYESLGPIWHRYQFAAPHTVSQNGGITAVSSEPTIMDVSFISSQGFISSSLWNEAHGVEWLHLSSPSVRPVAEQGGVTSVVREPGYTDRFWIGSDGSVWATNSAVLTVLPDGPVASGDSMELGEVLYPNDSIASADGRFLLHYQNDGNLVLSRRSDNIALWASNTHGMEPGACILQHDGNLVMVDYYGNVAWATNSENKNGRRLLVQSDGNVVLSNWANNAIWTTKTEEKKEEELPKETTSLFKLQRVEIWEGIITWKGEWPGDFGVLAGKIVKIDVVFTYGLIREKDSVIFYHQNNLDIIAEVRAGNSLMGSELAKFTADFDGKKIKLITTLKMGDDSNRSLDGDMALYITVTDK